VREAFEQAAARAGLVERYYALAEARLCVRLACTALVDALMPALEHRRVPPGPADLVVHLWDTASTGVAMPPPPVALPTDLPRGEVPGMQSDRFQLAVGLDAASVSLLDGPSGHGYYWIRAAEDVTIHERGAPVRSLLHWWMRARGRHMVHAAAIGTAHGGVLLAGRGGSGKSTTALACLSAGLRYAGDDYCLLTVEGEPYVHSVYSSAKVQPGQLRHFPRLQAAIANPTGAGDEKSLIFLQPLLAAQMIAGFPLKALLLPRITGQPATGLTRATAFEALRALAPSSIMQLPGAGAVEFEGLSRLVQRVPCYWLELGTAVGGIPAVVQTLLPQA
jgi:hypothetical protein